MIRSVAVFAVALAMLGGPALARSSDCSSLPSSTVQDRNQRSLCRALAEGKASHCSSISGDNDLKRLCEAQASGEERHCSSIGSSDKRAFCRGVTGGR